MKTLSVLLLLCLLCPVDALAHRVNLFAWVEGGEVVVECSFRKNQPVREGRLAVLSGRDGTVLLEGSVDADGRWRFPVPAEAAVQGLKLHLKAGEGHENDWTMAPDEFGAVVSPPPAPAPEPPAAAPEIQNITPQTPPHALSPLTAPEAQRIVNEALNIQLAPIRRQLANLSSGEPTLRDVVGGIGWILGLAGAAVLFRRRSS